jgi:hypothetical protein
MPVRRRSRKRSRRRSKSRSRRRRRRSSSSMRSMRRRRRRRRRQGANKRVARRHCAVQHEQPVLLEASSDYHPAVCPGRAAPLPTPPRSPPAPAPPPCPYVAGGTCVRVRRGARR